MGETLVGTAITNVAVTGVSVSPTTQTLTIGGTQQLTATVAPTDATNKTVSWTTNNATVATVSTSGLVTAVAAGSATISATTQDGAKTNASVIAVVIPVTGVTLSPASATISAGSTLQLSATVVPTNATNKTVNWTTSDASVATVSSSGLVTAVAAGPATITATTQDAAKIATSLITVSQSITTTLNPSADAYVFGGATSTNYGADISLLVKKGTSSAFFRKSFVKFDLTTAGFTNIQSAKVRLYASTVAAFSVAAYQTTDSWTETGITYTTAPATGTLIKTVSVTTAGTWYEWDVTAYVQSQYSGDKIVSLVFNDASAANLQISFDSKEGTNKPQLVINDLKISKVKSFINLNSETSEQLVSVYPNPLNHDKLTIKLEGYEELDNAEAIISNLQGQIVYQKLIPNNKTLEINTTGLLKSSIYLVSVRSGKLITNTKLIVR